MVQEAIDAQGRLGSRDTHRDCVATIRRSPEVEQAAKTMSRSAPSLTEISMRMGGKEQVLQAAFHAIECANSWNLTEHENSYLFDRRFDTAPKSTIDGRVPAGSHYLDPRPAKLVT